MTDAAEPQALPVYCLKNRFNDYCWHLLKFEATSWSDNCLPRLLPPTHTSVHHHAVSAFLHSNRSPLLLYSIIMSVDLVAIFHQLAEHFMLFCNSSRNVAAVTHRIQMHSLISHSLYCYDACCIYIERESSQLCTFIHPLFHKLFFASINLASEVQK
jgi:hypothetical protein